MARSRQLSYVLPLRWEEDRGLAELAGYLRGLTPLVAEIVVVDGSPEELRHRHRRALGGVCRLVQPDSALDFAMGKVNGVITGVLAARCELVLIADDDVRWDVEGLERVAELLRGAHLVRPQNYFEPLPWHARLDTARTLLNRVHTGDRQFPSGDFPGTLALRRSALVATGGYDGDVMFENLELMRTIAAAGGVVLSPLDLYVRRLPPTASHYFGQRVRQAFDDLGVPLRQAAFLAIAPAVIAAARRGRGLQAAATIAAASIGLAEAGRRRASGRRRYPPSSALLSPLWVAERALTSWLALASKLRFGGIRYAGRIVPRGVNSPRTLRRRLAAVELPAARGPEADRLVGAVAEGVQAGAAAPAERNRASA